MPQIFVILGERAQILTDEQLDDLMHRFTDTIERVFEIKGKKDVAYTIINARKTGDEKDLQLEYRYTAGTREYSKRRVFNPSTRRQALLIEQTKEDFARFLRDHDLLLSISVWTKPFRGGKFEAFEKPTGKF